MSVRGFLSVAALNCLIGYALFYLIGVHVIGLDASGLLTGMAKGAAAVWFGALAAVSVARWKGRI